MLQGIAEALDGIGNGIGPIVAAGGLAALVALLSTRESRNKRYDDMRTVDMDSLREDVKTAREDAKAERVAREAIEKESDRLRIENTDLQIEISKLKAQGGTS